MAAQLENDLGWLASLSLGYRQQGGRTVLARRAHRGPLVVQRPFYPEGDVCHSYLLHPPGGIVGGDRLTLTVEVDAGAHALITTPGAGKYYRSDGREAQVRQSFRVAERAALEWLPQENLLFDATRVDMSTRVELAADARFIGWEVTALGRPASGERYISGHCRQKLEVWREGRPLLIERATLAGGHRLLDAPWGLAGRSVTATLLAVTGDESVAIAARDAARTALGMTGSEPGQSPEQSPEQSVQISDLSGTATTRDGDWLGVSVLNDVLVCRYLGPGAQQARRHLERVWAALRPLLLARKASVPRIWYT